MSASPTSPLGGDDLAKALRDAYGQGYAVGSAFEASSHDLQSSARKRLQRDAWIAQYMARLPAAETIGRAEQDAPVQWGDPKTIADLIAQLRTLPPDAPIYGTFHGPDFPEDGRRRTGVRGVTLSREYVKGRWMSRDPDAELQHVIWTKAAEPEATPKSSPDQTPVDPQMTVEEARRTLQELPNHRTPDEWVAWHKNRAEANAGLMLGVFYSNRAEWIQAALRTLQAGGEVWS